MAGNQLVTGGGESTATLPILEEMPRTGGGESSEGVFMSLETVKKTKAPAKPRKTTAKVETAPKPKKVTTKEKTAAAPMAMPSHEEIAMLAQKYWAERGWQDGAADQDWLRAEHELLGKAS
jgi:Protein of unknown function (DUF2934)